MLNFSNHSISNHSLLMNKKLEQDKLAELVYTLYLLELFDDLYKL